MAFTKRSDLIIPELLQEAIQGEFAGLTVLSGTGVAVVSNTLPNGSRGGDTVKIPYFGTLGEAEDIANEGDALTPESLAMTDETATVIHSGKAFETTEWARMAAQYADPYKEAARQLRIIVERRADKALLDAATASLDAAYIHNVYNASVPVTFTRDVMVDAKIKWGDEQDQILLAAMHSKVYGDVTKLKFLDGSPQLTEPQDDKPARLAGVALRASDRCTVTADTPPKYETIIAKRAALAFWWAGEPVVLPFEDELAHTSGMAVHFYFTAHRYKRVRGGTKPGIIKIITN